MAIQISSYLVNQLNESFCIPLFNGRYGGYKIELLKQNLTPIEEKFVVCPSCAGIMKNASFSVGKNMCESCCPETEKSTPVESVRETVNKLPCRCPLDTKGCAWNGVIGELETHLSVCEHLMVPCPFVDYGCEVGLVRRSEMQSHLKEFSTQHMMGRIMKVEEENRKAFEKINFLTNENTSLREKVDELKMIVFGHVVNSNLRHTLSNKELHGFQFTITDIKERIESGNISPGPMTYLKMYKIQVHYKLTTHVTLYFARIPGKHDAELNEGRVGLFYYQIINSEDTRVTFDLSKTISHPLTINKMSPDIACLNLKDRVISNTLTMRVFFEAPF